MHTHITCVCLATYCMINYAAITVVINVNEELVHDLMLSCFLYSPHCEVHGLSLVSATNACNTVQRKRTQRS